MNGRLILTVVALMALFPALANAGALRLFVLSGQSNMEGMDPDVSFIPATNPK